MDSYYADLNLKMEVYSVVREMVDDIEMWDVENALLKTQKNLLTTQQLNDTVISKMRQLVDKNTKLEQELLKIKQVAQGTRELFVKDIGLFLSENKQVKKLKDRISELEVKLEHVAMYGTLEPVEDTEVPVDNKDKKSGDVDSQDISAQVSEADNTSSAPAQAVVTVIKEQQMFLYDLDDEFLLHIFSYFDEGSEVLNVAHSCRHFFSRVNALFDIPNPLVQPEWSLRPRRYALPAPAQPATNATPSTPERASKAPSSAPTPDRANALAASKGPPSAVPAVPPAPAGNAVPPAAPAPQDPVLTKEIIDVLIKKLTRKDKHCFEICSVSENGGDFCF